jgi:hypothetical protein
VKKIIFSCFFSLFLVFDVFAAPQFESDVSVDITASSVAEAKKLAMSKAVRDGLNNVILSVSTQATVDELNKLNDNQIQHFVSEVMVLMEKSSDVRYIADLRISVNEGVLKSYIEENNLPLVVGEEQDVLVIPLLEKEDGSFELWGPENVWRDAFANKKNLRKGNLNINLIQKNLGNITVVETNRIFDMSENEYHEMSSFNNVEDIYVLKYSLKDGKVYVKYFPKGDVSEVLIEESTMSEMVDKVLPFFKDVKKVSHEAQNSVVVEEVFETIYNYPRLGKWMELKQLLESIPQVQEVKVISLAKGKVHFRFKYVGVIEKLQTTLGLKGYHLSKEGDFYAIN